MDKYQVDTVASFWEDLGAALDYIAFDLANPLAAKRLYDKVITKTAALSVSPLRGRIVDDYYSVKVGKYRVIYRVMESERIVKLLHFWYSRRDIVRLLRQG